MPDNSESACLKKIIEALYDEQKSLWSNEKKGNVASKAAIDLKVNLSSHDWKEIGDFDLKESVLSSSEIDFSKKKLVMFLPPFEKETAAFVPVMSLKYVPSENNFCVRIMMLTSAYGDRPIPCQSIGFRVESPHESNEGRHKFYHSQLINNFDYGPWRAQTAEIIDWLPKHQPSFPVCATNSVEAVLCLILTLYGRIYYNKFYGAHSRGFKAVVKSEFTNRLFGTS